MEERYVRVEPMVSIGRLMEALVAKGWMVPIVPEIGKLFIMIQCGVMWVGLMLPPPLYTVTRFLLCATFAHFLEF